MSTEPKRGARWLDSLARWSAGGRGDTRPQTVAGGGNAGEHRGTSRRTALRTAAGAGALAVLAPTSLLQPSTAGAIETSSPLEKCLLDEYSSAYNELKACTKGPLEDYDNLSEAIARDENFLRAQKKAGARKQLKKNIARAKRERAAVEKEVDFCNALFLEERAKGEAKCQATCNSAFSPNRRRAGEQCSAPGESGSGGSGGSSGCESGFLLCGEYCCDLRYATCVGCNGTPICCRIDGNCCPGE